MKKEALAAALVGLGLTACGGGVAFNEDTILYTDPITASDPALQRHEKCHVEQMKAMGGSDKFWKKYMDDPQFRREAEIMCGVDCENDPDSHFACR